MSGTKFFQNFPSVPYRFGDQELPVNFQNLSVYIDIFDQIREEQVFYQSYYIQNNQRPDQLSYEVYGTTDYYWTLFLNNEHLRINGWPLDNSELYGRAQKYYPNKVITTNGVSLLSTVGTRPISASPNFEVGSWVHIPAGGIVAKILKVDQNLFALHLDSETITTVGTTGGYSTGDVVNSISASEVSSLIADPSYTPAVIDQTFIQSVYNGWDAIHHYENSSGDWVYPTYQSTTPYPVDWTSVNTFQSVSYYQRMVELNDEMRTISIIRPENVIKLVSDYNALLKQRL